MNYFIVSGVLYQTQEKMKQLEEERKKKKKRSLSDSSKSSRSTISRKGSHATILSKNKSEPEQKSISKSQPVNAQDLSNNLTKLNKSSSFINIKLANKNKLSYSTTSSDSPKSLRDRPEVNEMAKAKAPMIQSNSTTSSSSSKSKNLTTPIISTSVSSNELENRKNILKKKDIFGLYFETASPIRESTNPVFVPLIDLSLINTPETISKGLLTPAYQVIRFNNFLQLLSISHKNDAVSFAGIRHNSLVKFIHRHECLKESQDTIFTDSFNIPKNRSNSYYDSLITFELFSARAYIRKLIMQRSKSCGRCVTKVSEELTQLNITNYVRFLLELPSDIPKNADQETLNHYQFKRIFVSIATEVLRLKNDNSEEGGLGIANFLLLLVNKLSYEYILLEKYRIDIWYKLAKNSLIDTTSLKHLYQLYQTNKNSEVRGPVKILLFNMFNSAQYSWYFSIHIPFARVIELSSFIEDPKIINNFDTYLQHEEGTPKHSFEERDSILQGYFKRLDLGDFSKYRNLSSEQLVQRHKNVCSGHNEAKNMLESGTSTLQQFKPFNFEYFNKPLAAIPSGSIDLIQSRDLNLQLTQENYKVILRELYRILSNGGILEAPIFQANMEAIKATESVGTLDSDWKYLDIDLKDSCGTIPNFTKFLLSELNSLFGHGQVKYGIVVLNSVKDIKNFLLTDISLYYGEIFGSKETFSQKLCDEKSFDEYNDKLVTLIYIKAIKKDQ